MDPKTTRNALSPDALDVRIRAAWLYYIEGLTQEQVAQRLGINRIKVLRILAACREEGLIQVSINAKAGMQVSLERRLERHLGLDAVIVVPESRDDASAALLVGHAAGLYISEQIRDGMTIGVGWGATLQTSLRSLTWRDLSDVAFVSLLGGLTHATALNPSAVAWRLADFYKAECYQITAPVYVHDEALASALWAQPDLMDLRARARGLDLALISVGDISPDATIFHRDMLPAPLCEELLAAGAVGDVLCRFIDKDGRVLDHDVNRRAMAIAPSELGLSARIAIASGGARKANAIRAGIAATGASVLITDETAAEAILRLPPLPQA